jgi:hypothetical protein
VSVCHWSWWQHLGFIGNCKLYESVYRTANSERHSVLTTTLVRLHRQYGPRLSRPLSWTKVASLEDHSKVCPGHPGMLFTTLGCTSLTDEFLLGSQSVTLWLHPSENARSLTHAPICLLQVGLSQCTQSPQAKTQHCHHKPRSPLQA